MVDNESREERSPKTRTTAPPLKRTLRYVSRFGLSAGMRVARVHRRSSHPISLRLPGFSQPLWVRPGTSDALTFDEVFVAREYELPTRNFSPQHVLDLGANVGYASVLFTSRWPQAKILAVEPERENMVLLKRNTGGYPSIDALHAAVWSRSGQVVIANPHDDANAFRMTDVVANEAEKVPAYTISQLIDRMGCERLDLLKVDIEGAEVEILQDTASWLNRVNVMIIELHDRLVLGCGESFCAALQGRRFSLEIMGQNLVVDLRSERERNR